MKRTIIQLTIIITATLLTISCNNNPKTNNTQTLSKADSHTQSPTQNLKQIQSTSYPLQLPENLQPQTIERKVQSLPRHNNISYTTPTFDTTNYNGRKEYLITPTEKQLVKHTGVALFIGEGSVKKPTTISITPLTEKETVNIPTNLVNLTEYHNGYRFLPDGQTFEQEIAVAMKYDTTNIPFGYGAADIFTYYYDTKSSQWEQIPRDSVDEINHIIYSRTTHFTDYINGVLKVPETSDAMAYTPTSIKDLKAAEPLNGITLMSPPQANNKGTANLSYPITVPAGRRGMQPNLNVTYNSEGGSSWLGLGWDINISSITVETRWGVPSYDPTNESETYLLDGETLVTQDLAQSEFRLNKPTYRNVLEARYEEGKQFYPRVEGSFRKIIRHGTIPTDYWWEVIDKSGTKYFYGKKQTEDGLDPNGVLSDDSKGNIARWCLTRVEDVFGNYMTYEYVTKYTKGHNTGGTIGKQIYPKDIKYTGHKVEEGSGLQPEDGKYKVSFIVNESIREDITTSGRYGFKETNAWLLDKIEVKYNNNLLRAYYFGYKAGFAGKTLLCNFIDADSLSINQKYFNNGTEITDTTTILERDIYNRCSEPYPKYSYCPYIEHRFNYETLTGGMFSDETDINTQNDGIKGNIIPFLGMKVGSLEGSLTKSHNYGGAADVGYNWNVMSKTFSIGGSYMYGGDNSEGLLNFIDLNGDGYVDKLYKKNDAIYYRLRNPSSNSFGAETSFNSNIGNFSKSSGHTNTWGIEGDLVIGGFGVNWTDGKTTTSGYFIDLNGDGLVDFVDNDKKYINQLNSSGYPTFTRINEFQNGDIPIQGDCGIEYVSSGEPVDEDIFSSGTYEVRSTKCMCVEYDRDEHCIRDSCWEEVETVEYEYPETFEPNIDNVRVWVAPYSGTIKIEGIAELTPESFSLNQLTHNDEGIKLSIEKQGTRLSQVTLKPIENYQSSSFSNVSSIPVIRGEKIYFRMQSLGKRKYDEIIWNPTISYLNATYTRGSVTINADMSNPLDATGLNMYKYNYSEDFLLSGQQKIKIPFAGKIAIIRNIKSPGLKGNVKCRIIGNANNDIQSFFISNNTIINDTTTYDVQKDDSINIVMRGEGNTNWSSIDANIRIVVIEKTGGTAKDIYNTYSDGVTKTYYYNYCPMIDKASSAYQKIPSKKQTTTSQSLIIKPKLFSTDPSAREITITVKDVNGNALLSQIFFFYQGYTPPTYTVYLNGITNYFIDYYVWGPNGEPFVNALATVNNVDVDAGLYINYPDTYDKFGVKYRNWGQFGYWNHNDNLSPINESLLVLDDAFNQTSAPNPSSFTIPTSRTSNVNSAYNPLSSTFFLMLPDFEKKCLIGYGDCIYTDKEVVANKVYSTYTSTEEVDLTDSPLPISENNNVPVTTVNKLTYTDNFGYDIGLSIPIIGTALGLNQSISYTNGSTRQVADMMDVNGDRYPDIVSEINVQYSQPQGGLCVISRPHAVGGRYSDSTYNTTEGGSFGGSYVVAKKLLSNNPMKSLTTLSAGTGASISEATTQDHTQYSWVDINGDGLIDKVTKDGRVNLNIGNGFLSDEIWYNVSSVRRSLSQGTSIGVSASGSSLTTEFGADAQDAIDDLIGSRGIAMDDLLTQISDIADDAGNSECNVSINLGIGGTQSGNVNEYSYVDINGDGLVDKVSGTKVYYNLGDKFSTSYTSILPNFIETATSYNANITGAFTLGATLGFLPIKIQGNPKIGGARSVAMKEVKWIDMNNDGYPDCVRDGRNGILKVKYSNLGKVNLLKEVVMPTLSSCKIDYSLSQSTTSSPQRHWTMSSLIINDGFSEDCNETRKIAFEYKNRKYSRYEREDYGFDTIITTEYIHPTTPYRKTIESYYNNGYMFKGLNYASTQTNATLDTTYIENIKTYKLHEILTGVEIDTENPQCYGDGYPAISKEEVLYYDNNQLQVTTEKNYIYTSYGNVTEYQDLGDITTDDDNVYSYITYSNDETNYYVSLVSNLEIKDQQNNLLRNRQATYNSLGVMDYLTVITNSGNIEYNYEYDDYGNIIKTILPSNNVGQRMTIDYEYDNTIHTYPVRVINSHQYESTSTYDYRWGKPLITTDISGNQMHYIYDSRGRTKTVRGPKEIASGQLYTIKYNYWDRERRMQGEQKKIIPWSKTSNYDPEYPTNDIEIITFTDGLGKIIQIKKDIDISGVKKRSVSGKIMYDALDRPIANYHPQVELIVNYPYSDTIFNHLNNSLYPTITTYEILDRPLTVTSPDNTTTQNTYSFGQDFTTNRFETTIQDQNGNKTIIYTDPRQLKTQITNANLGVTQFIYDALGQLTSSVDPEIHSTTYEYDMAGRRTSRNHPSSGLTTWGYDQAGNITRQTMSSGEYIDYTYNYNQLTNVTYSHRYWNNVWYQYGTTGNERGRLVKQQDAAGIQEFKYGNMGELVGTLHTYLLPNSSQAFSLITIWDYDSWNRVKYITYPDGEKLTYNYNKGGLLDKISGNKDGNITDYIRGISYDEYEQRTLVNYGNGTQSIYSYDPQMRRMSNLNTKSSNGQSLLNNKYTYDPVGNITQIENTGQSPYIHKYHYDGINQLDTSSGTGTWNTTTINYGLKLEYSPSGRIINKNVSGQKLDNSYSPITMNYNNSYTYNYPNNPYGVKQIYNSITGKTDNFRWDSKGNMTMHSSSQWKERFFCWTEDNRLEAVKDNKMGAFYNYDASGERNLKLNGGTMDVTQNGSTTNIPVLTDQTLYASALVTVNDKGYTKHYFEEGSRICSKIGGGKLRDVNTISTPIHSNIDDLLIESNNIVRRSFGECISINTELQIKDLYKNIIEKYKGQPSTTEFSFYYHSDHLGSGSYITGDNGLATQTVAYLPFGEDWVDMKYGSPTYETPYKFNGKEKDEETGYNYYGARYYSSPLSIFISTDPMSDKYPSLSSYTYCANNPVMLIDPDGRDWYRNDESGATFWQKGKANTVFSNDQTYRNVGETHSVYKDGLRINYTQNDITNITEASPRFNLEGGEYIPNTITTDDGTRVNVTFNYNSPTGGNGDKALSKDAVGLFITGVNEANNSGAGIKSIDVSTTTTGTHSNSKSLHYVANGARAFDVDAVNGVAVKNAKSHNRVNAMQNGMKKNSNLYENYGPNIQEKAGMKKSISGHDNHIHASTKKGDN